MISFGRYLRARLHRQIFVWLAVSIVLGGLLAGAAVWLTSPAPSSWRRLARSAQTFVGDQLAAVWDDEAARTRLLARAARDLELDLVLRDAGGALLYRHGSSCHGPRFTAAVDRAGQRLGTLEACLRHRHRVPGGMIVGLLASALILWAAAGIIARRVTRPLAQLVRVARDIGEGRLDSRMELGRVAHGELGFLAQTVNEMAARIQKQLSDQRELLAGVSHELRTPLARMRVLTEMLREDQAAPRLADELEREVLEIDDLVDRLLASSRLDFAPVRHVELDAAALAGTQMQRTGVDAALLRCEQRPLPVTGDPALLGRALANLLSNAAEHGGGVLAVLVRARAGEVLFEVEDAGPGFTEEERAQVFTSFYRGQKAAGAMRRPREHQSVWPAGRDRPAAGSAGGGEGAAPAIVTTEPRGDAPHTGDVPTQAGRIAALGLGLALVRRIAEAHGGRAWAENLAEGGARVGFSVRRR